MITLPRRPWMLPESAVTPETIFLNRRSFMGAASGLVATGLAGGLSVRPGFSQTAPASPPVMNKAFASAGRPVTEERFNTTYNNFYEFGTSKDIAGAAEALPVQPWTLVVDGLVDKPLTLSIEDLTARMPLEERIVRHRCVEAWAMVVPWTGFPLKALLDLVQPTSAARYVKFETFNLPDIAPGQAPGFLNTYPWPYTEGLTLAEARNDLAFLATGAYGKPLPKSMGAPIRLHVPWKYGFKSAKSLVHISLVAEQPKTFWEALASDEYGFWANVNPAVAHPRWSQAQERMLGTNEMVPTVIFNGYGEWVADLYKDMKNEKLFI